MKSLVVLTSLAALLTAAAGGASAAPRSHAPPMMVVQRIPGPDGFWDYASFDPVKRRVYVAHGDTIMAIDADTGKVNPHFADAARSHEVLPLAGGAELLTTNSGDNTARIYDTATGALKATIPTAKDPDAAAYDPATKRVFVMDGDSGEITIIDPAAGKATGSITVGGALEFAVADGKGRLYLNVEDKNEIVVVDSRAAKVLAHYPMPGCEGPTGLALTREGLLISACANGVAEVLDAASGKKIAALKIGPRPDAAIYDPARSRVYIPSGGDGTLAVLRLSGRKVTAAAVVHTQTGARTGTLDPRTGRIYLPAAKFTPPLAPGQRPAFVPGSFEVLVVAAG